MFILEPTANIQENCITTDETNNLNSVTDIPVKMNNSNISDDNFLNKQYSFDQMVRLRSLFLGLVQQKRWIYFLNDNIQLRADHLPVLQVKLKEHHNQYDCIQRIVSSGHCSAIVLEKSKMNELQIKHIHNLCFKQKVQLILLENLQDNDKLH